MMILHVYVVHLCLCSVNNHTMLKHTSYNCARPYEVYRASAPYRVFTLVKNTGLWGSNMVDFFCSSHHWLIFAGECQHRKCCIEQVSLGPHFSQC